MDGSVLILDQTQLPPTPRLLEDQRLFSGTALKVFLRCQLSLKDPSQCLMRSSMLLPRAQLQLPEEVTPLLYLRKIQDQKRNFLTSVLEEVLLSNSLRVSNCLESLP